MYWFWISVLVVIFDDLSEVGEHVELPLLMLLLFLLRLKLFLLLCSPHDGTHSLRYYTVLLCKLDIFL